MVCIINGVHVVIQHTGINMSICENNIEYVVKFFNFFSFMHQALCIPRPEEEEWKEAGTSLGNRIQLPNYQGAVRTAVIPSVKTLQVSQGFLCMVLSSCLV